MRRRRQIEESAGRDRWMVSYADFITVLFAFFVVMFASSLSQSGHSVRKVSQAIHIGFQNLQPFREDDAGPAAIEVPGGSTASHEQPGLEGDSNSQRHAQGIPGVDVQALRRQLESSIGADLRDGEVTTRTTPEGFVISLKELGFFHSGDAELQPGAGAKIERIANVLAERGFSLRIEGHSDNQPINNAHFRSNWQLSTARATAVLMLLVNDSRLDPSKLSLAGYGEYRPIASNATPEGRRLNRRVDLVVFSLTAGTDTVDGSAAAIRRDEPSSTRRMDPPHSP